MQKKYSDSLKGVNQRVALEKMISSHAVAGRGEVLKHESSQRSTAFNKTVEASNKTAINMAAGTSDPAALGLLMKTSGDAYFKILNQGRVPGADSMVQGLYGEMVEASFNAQLEDNPKQAQKILERHAELIGDGKAAQLRRALEGKILYEEQAALYNTVYSKYRLSDGTPDLKRIQQEIMRNPKMTMEKKNRIWDYAKGRAGEDRTQVHQQRDAADRSFFNKVAEIKKGGGSMDQAMKLVPSMAYDPTDRQSKEEYVRKLYTSPQTTDPVRYIDLWEGIQNSTRDIRDIDLGLQEGWLKHTDWETLRKEYYRSQTDGDTPGEQEVRKRVKLYADDNIPDPKDRNEFLYVWQTSTKGMSPETKFNYAQELFKKRDSGKWYVPNKKAYKVELQSMDTDVMEKTQLFNTMGRSEVLSIAKGIMGSTGKTTWSMADFNNFAKEFGGPEKIMPGTPVYNAIQSLRRYRKLITPAAIRLSLKHYPEGKF
jgi:hypothetical protein